MPRQTNPSPVPAGAKPAPGPRAPGHTPKIQRSPGNPARDRRVDALALGSAGEDLAAEYLAGLGYRVIARNWRCTHGELDLICLDAAGSLVMVEVKTRTNDLHGHPCETVTPRKARRMREAARHWIAAHDWRHGAIRFDIVGIITRPGNKLLPDITHLRDVC
ncbi:YraN family protein [Lolliginicoccus suaedae]|uniref:YraN family protein n=1 Tax=Lolliginicoccus suaedae TaxID=2605429 RepID=UPI0011EEB255|nr:YraN family protein [Lolliginicoccus suaedae]